MQTRDQVKNWKVVATVASVAALGLSGLAVASPGETPGAPAPINLDDQRSIDEATFTTDPEFAVVSNPTVLGDDLDSPLDTMDDTGDDLDDLEDSPDADDISDDVDDSPEPSGATVDDDDDSPDSDDSPDDGDDDSLDS